MGANHCCKSNGHTSTHPHHELHICIELAPIVSEKVRLSKLGEQGERGQTRALLVGLQPLQRELTRPVHVFLPMTTVQ